MIFVRTSIQFGDFVFDLWALSEQSLMLVNQLKRQDTDSLFVVCITLILLLYTAFSKSKCYVIFVSRYVFNICAGNAHWHVPGLSYARSKNMVRRSDKDVQDLYFLNKTRLYLKSKRSQSLSKLCMLYNSFSLRTGAESSGFHDLRVTIWPKTTKSLLRSLFLFARFKMFSSINWYFETFVASLDFNQLCSYSPWFSSYMTYIPCWSKSCGFALPWKRLSTLRLKQRTTQFDK